MKKLVTFIFATLGIFLVTSLTSQAEDNICACYNKNHGQLRVVGDPSECTNAEVPITLSGSIENETSKLACVTAAYEPAGTPPDNVWITNQKNIEVDDWNDVFEIVTEYRDTGEDELELNWGLKCKDEWVNTGCSQEVDIDSMVEDDADIDIDVEQINNGCLSDDEEYEYVVIYTTCCKNIAVITP